MNSARLAALRVLVSIERGHTTLATELDRVRPSITDERDRALLTELAVGVLRWRAALDALLAQCSNRPIETLDTSVRNALRLGAYQIDHLDRVPPHAVVHETVESVRSSGVASAAGFVNAVLRTFLRDRSKLTLPTAPTVDAPISHYVRYLSATLSHPPWLIERWLPRYGPGATTQWCVFNNRTPDVTIRPQSGVDSHMLLKSIRATGVDATPARFVSDAISLPAGSITEIPAALRSQFVVQDEGSQIVAHLVDVTVGDRALDLCAAPGGKTTIMREAAGPTGTVVACDFRPGRIHVLRRALSNAGVGAPIVRLDATTALPFAPVFDRVLIDAPCSGLGTVRRDPDVKWTRAPDDLRRFAHEQRLMLTNAAR